ncbi:c-type cytochrome biogenesis protein CcmI [Pelagibacterium limicola]|uniref:c-type cytochrome biogenesis protein CcmI n=1 Tax=Pelagibacterium limicola TaxID=2791022 RepID=UPI001FE4317B|nr:c-type cytochrome biogenesis protein CcmI [Pelagibacterium limicola]
MLWLFAALLTLTVLAALYFAMRRPVMAEDGDAPTRAFLRSQLEGIEEDLRIGRISDTEAVAARAELAREVMRFEREKKHEAAKGSVRLPMLVALPLVALVAFGTYFAIGRADLPAQPLAARDFAADQTHVSIAEAVAQVEARLVETPNDVRGWRALAPVYMQMGRYPEAANAFRRILALDPPDAETETDLAEALIMVNDGMADDDVIALLRSAADRDPMHVRSRFYLAGELTRREDYDEAAALWQYLLDIAVGTEPWVATARSGLAAAQAGTTGGSLAEPTPDATQEVMIRGMVEGLAARLYDEGGSAAEWMQLVRSRLVIDGADAARDDLQRGLAELAPEDRIALEAFAQELGL